MLPVSEIPHRSDARPRRGGASASREGILLWCTGLIALLLFATGCEGSGEDQLFDLDRSVGRIEAVVFADLDRSGTFGGQDRPLADTWVGIRPRGTLDTIASGRTSAEGEITFAGLPAGALDVLLEGGVLGDSLVRSGTEPDPVVVIRRDVNPLQVFASYPIVDPGDLDATPVGRRVFVEGVAAHASGTLPASALHVKTDEHWIRIEGTTGPAVAEGDSVRVRGRVARFGSISILTEGLRATTGGSGSIAPVPTSTGQASQPNQALAAALVRIDDATVNQTIFQGGVATAVITDGSGSLRLEIPAAHLNDAALPIPDAGSRLDVSGILVPSETGARWQLRTRGGDDLDVRSTGTIEGRVFVDRNRDGEFNGSDAPVPGVLLRVRAAELGGSVLGEGETGPDGRFRIDGRATGRYLIELDPFTYPDSLVVGAVTPSPIPVRTDQTTQVLVPLLAPETDSFILKRN